MEQKKPEDIAEMLADHINQDQSNKSPKELLEEAIEALFGSAQEFYQEMLAGLSEAQLQQLGQLLDKLTGVRSVDKEQLQAAIKGLKKVSSYGEADPSTLKTPGAELVSNAHKTRKGKGGTGR